MTSRVKMLKWLMWIIVYYADCASLQKCVQSSLSFNRVPELTNYDSVIVNIIHPLQVDSEQVYSLSSLCDEARCSVRGCFQRDTQYTLKVYANDGNSVPKALVTESNLQPDCGQEGIAEMKNGADGNVSNMFLIWFTVCLWIVFHLAI